MRGGLVRRRLPIALGILCLALNACTGSAVRAPVGREDQAPTSLPDSYTVRRGDTLYAIAWRYGLDFRDVAGWNGIRDPFRIFPGDTLRLNTPRKILKPIVTAPAKPAVKKSPSGKPRTSTRPAAKPKDKTRAKPKARSKVKNPVVVASGPLRWSWPAQGKLLKRFSTRKGSKGVDIGGKLGQPVFSAAPGRVVYAGSGLSWYGKLIIVKHNNRYLSAYAHNHRTLVREGDQIKGGQRIADMGQTGTKIVKVHFEIRRDGRPVDPLRYLPKERH